MLKVTPEFLPSCALCDGEVIVQGDEGPVRGVAQGVDCHGVTISHEEKEGRRGTARGRK